MKNVVANLTAAVIAGGILLAGSGVASAAAPQPPAAAIPAVLSGDDEGKREMFVDPRQEHNTANCYFDKSKSGKEKQKYCKALIGKDLTAKEKECLKRAGLAGAAALTLGRMNNKKAKEIAANTAVGALAACFSAKIK
ncbi:hypothetical protein [Streptomyces sp. NPDC048606]|uniref:hypothetical protein n=1 Tax=Streptomyces sp. NPDC048606 TaxID=3154726 RepID=UPI0034179C79